MTLFTRQSPEQIMSQQAADFIAKSFSGQASPDTERDLMTWLEESPRHKQAYQDMLDIWDASEELDHYIPPKTTPWRQWAIYSVAGLALILATLWFSWQDSSLARYVTAVGEQKTVTLADGSLVTLNTDTRLIVDYSEKDVLRLFLDRGEAFFDVAKNHDRVFTVKAGTRSVTALGTKFSVLRDHGDLTVAVTEGAVAVHNPQELKAATKTILELLPPEHQLTKNASGPFRIDAGGVATFSDSDHIVAQLDMTDIEKHVSWHEGYLRFEDERLDFVVGQMNRYMKRQIIIKGADIQAQRISGLFRLDDVEGMWRGLERILPVKIEEHSDEIIITARQEKQAVR